MKTISDDFYNLQKERNSGNTHRCEYNCGGFALGSFIWYQFSVYEDNEHFSLDYPENYILNDYIDEILDDYNGYVRRINSPQELKSNEYLVLFKLSFEQYGDYYIVDDFHFIKQVDGIFYDKPGSRALRETPEQDLDTLINDDWETPHGLPYNSECGLLAIDKILL